MSTTPETNGEVLPELNFLTSKLEKGPRGYNYYTGNDYLALPITIGNAWES